MSEISSIKVKVESGSSLQLFILFLKPYFLPSFLSNPSCLSALSIPVNLALFLVG